MLYEISRKRIIVNKHEETSLSWNDSVLVVRGNKNLHLIEFSYNLHSLEKEIDLTECTISASYDSPVPNNFLSNYAARGVKNLELVEMITNPAFWPHNKLLTQEMTNIVAYKWSPNNLINNNQSVLATVNSVGNVEFFGQKTRAWASILNFSKEMMKHLSSRYEILNKCPKEFKQMEDVVYSIETSTICWAPELNPDNSCYLATAQKSGEILFWLLKYNTLQVEFCGSVQNSNKFETPLMVWIPVDKSNFFLILTNECGEVFCNECEIVQNNITLHKEHGMWLHKDKMMVTNVEYKFENDNLLILFNKHRHLIVQMYDKTFQLLSQCIRNINDFRISSITKSNNILYLSTINTKIFRIDYSVIKDSIEVILKLFETKDSYTTYELFGLSFSTNNILFALPMIDRRLLHRKESLKIEIVFLCHESEAEDDASAIINNPTKSLYHVKDYIEVLRCKIVKTKKLPKLDYNKLLDDGETDVYKLKVYLVFLIFYHSLLRQMTPNLKDKMPETSIDVIKDKILLSQSIHLVNDIYEEYINKSQLTDFQKESFECSKKFIKYYCKIYSKNVNDYITEKIQNLPSFNIEYTCQGCDEKILQFSCKDGHLNMFCFLSFTLIDSDEYLVCKSCRSTARMELLEQKPTCIYCDLYLNIS